MKKELRIKAKSLEPCLRIGKKGITEGQVIEIKKMLKKNKLIKIKMLRSFANATDRKKAAAEIAQKTNSEIIEQIGNVVVLYKMNV